MSGIPGAKSMNHGTAPRAAAAGLSHFRNCDVNCAARNPHSRQFSKFLPIPTQFPDCAQLSGWLRNRLVQ